MTARRSPTMLLLAAAALMLLCGASAARRDSYIKDMIARRGGGTLMEDEPAVVVVRYEVSPTLHDKFKDEWLAFEKVLRDTGGLTYYELAKTATDNTIFYAYTEWDTFGDMLKHIDTREHSDFMDFLAKNDIIREVLLLDAVGDTKREYRADREGEKVAAAARRAAAKDLERRRRRRGDTETEDPRDIPAHILIKFHVPPSMADKFEKAFTDVQERVVKDEDENRYYTLRRIATMNCHYVLRGGWDTHNAWIDHLTSKHFADLRLFAYDNDIEWTATPFRVLANSEEEM